MGLGTGILAVEKKLEGISVERTGSVVLRHFRAVSLPIRKT